MKSMTGYSTGRIESSLFSASMNLKGLNNRYLEINIFMPSFLASLDSRIRELISSRISRGKIEFGLRVLTNSMPAKAYMDSSAATAMAIALRQLAADTGIDESLRLSHLLSMDGILAFERDADSDEIWNVIAPELEQLIDDFDATRSREGSSTRADMEKQLFVIEGAIARAREIAPNLDARIAEEMKGKFREISDETVDESRIMTEIAAWIVKHTINEELVRLSSHIAAYRATMEMEQCGKRLDFICQELNREANTIGSKSQDYELSHLVIDMKEAVENLREQTRNIE